MLQVGYTNLRPRLKALQTKAITQLHNSKKPSTFTRIFTCACRSILTRKSRYKRQAATSLVCLDQASSNMSMI
eukprot:762167-Hanusia_phi.AAC.3